MRSTDDIVREFWAVRTLRDKLRAERAGLLCERAETVTQADIEDAQAEAQNDPLAVIVFPAHREPMEPCWKAARKWEDDGYRSRFYFDPPQSKWCETCRKRQAVSDAYRESVRKHGGALRGLLRRGKALAAPPAVDAVDPHLAARGTDAGPRA